MRSTEAGFEKGYRQGQVDYQQNKIKYKVDIKQVSDTVVNVVLK